MQQKTTEITKGKTTEKILRLIEGNPGITNKEMAKACEITEDGVYWNIKQLKSKGILRRIGSDRGGYWEIYWEIIPSQR